MQIASSNAVTAALLSALGIQTAATASATAATAGAEKAGAMSAIATDSGQMLAGFAAFFAPLLGPAAPAAAAGLTTGVTSTAIGLTGADIGMWDVPQDMPALVHRNELIMPAAQAGAFRDMLSGAAQGGSRGGGGNVTNHENHFHITSNDPRGVAREVAKIWNSNPSLRPVY
jgi:hypothetical protein